jgi:PAS domain S-box-containing protein
MESNGNPKVLIVDDERGIRVGTKRLLESEGYYVEAVENGTLGINSGTSKEFDFALIDLKMPDIDGLEVLREIKKVYPDTVCYIITAYASYDNAIEATKLGADSYLPKPFTPDELLKTLREGYEKRKLSIERRKWIQEREARLLEVAFEKTRLNTIINSITDGVLVVNKSGEVVLFNPGLLRYLDFEKLEIEEKIIPRLHPDLAALINKFLVPGTYDTKSYSAQIEIKPSGELFIEATSSAVPHPDGSLAGVVITIKNITELKKLEHLKSQFVSMVSHELKAPIAAVYGYLKLFDDDTIKLTAEQQKNYIKRSEIRLDGLLKMVNDLLDISRMEMKTVRREIKELNLNEIIENIIELFQVDIRNKNLNVLFNRLATEDRISADYDEITRLFTNLISNAIKYNKPNGEISISINVVEKFILTEIKDSGIGLKPEEKAKLFSEFFRAKNDYTKNISGTGLGLSIVKRIADSYNGRIEVDSEYGKGTSFKVFFQRSNKKNNNLQINKA